MQQFAFNVPVEWKGPPDDQGLPTPSAWLGHSLEVVRDLDQAAVLRFKLYPNGSEDAAIQRRIDDVSGGLAHTVDLEQGIDSTRAAILRALTERLYPAAEDVDDEGERRELGPMEAAQRRQAVNEAFTSLHTLDPDTEKDGDQVRQLQRQAGGLRRMLELQERIEVAACWTVLGLEHPPRWRDLADIEVATPHRNAIVRAFALARREAEAATGK